MKHKTRLMVGLLIGTSLVVMGVGIHAGVIHRILGQSQKKLTFDVTVVGAGPGGVAASIQAARMGARVALLEPTDWVGGQMTAAGVGNMDEGSTAVRGEGLYHDFIDRAIGYYSAKGVSVGTCYGGTNSICIDPRIGQAMLLQMLKQESANLQVFTHTPVTSVTKSGDTITGVVSNGEIFSSKVVIDADEYGDVLAMAGAYYRLGNGTSQTPAANACVQNITYTAVIKKYPAGVPKLLTFLKPPPGYTSSVVDHFKTALAQGFDKFIAFRGLPDIPASSSAPNTSTAIITRTSLNLDLSNDYPASGVLSTAFISNPQYREQSICDAKLLTIQLIYYIQHDLGESDWSIANDEGYDTPYNRSQHCAVLDGFRSFEYQMPQEPYVREARRVVGDDTLTGHELAVSWQDPKHVVTYPNSIAVGYYPMDIHGCRSPSTLEQVYDAPIDSPRVHKGGPFEVPLGVLIPVQEDGLIAAEKNISTSRFANGAVREQPIAMDIGQAAGALAALAVRQHKQPRDIAPSGVQQALQFSGLTIAIKQ